MRSADGGGSGWVRGAVGGGSAYAWTPGGRTGASASESLISGEPARPPSGCVGLRRTPRSPEGVVCSACIRAPMTGVWERQPPRIRGWEAGFPNPTASRCATRLVATTQSRPYAPARRRPLVLDPPIPPRTVEAPRCRGEVVGSSARDGPRYSRPGGVSFRQPAVPRVRGRVGGERVWCRCITVFERGMAGEGVGGRRSPTVGTGLVSGSGL